MSLTGQLELRLEGFTLSVELDEPLEGVTGVLGPSGSGKTTLLRCIAGLERASGRLARGDQVWQQDGGPFVPAHRRRVGLVFQEPSLFEHLSVRGNLEYGLARARRLALTVVDFSWLVSVLGLTPLLDRGVTNLSGGERQRVALGRALLAAPSLLLLDEPLANLDQAARSQVLDGLEVIERELRIPMIYVSHLAAEIARLADRLILLDAGRVVATGPLPALFTRLDLPLAHGDSAEAVIEARVVEHDETYHLTYVDFPGGRLAIPRVDAQPGAALRVRVPARDVSLALERAERTSILNILPAVVAEVAEEGSAQLLVRLDCAGTPLLARVTRKSGAVLGLQPGLRVFAQIKGIAVVR